jgi:hypothetical protein
MSILHDINVKITEAAQASADTPPEVKTIASNNQAVRRYQDAYTVAKTANAFGTFTKTIGLISAGIIGVIGLIMMLLTATSLGAGAGFVMLLFTLTLGAIVGAIFYILGIALSALGQNLMAALDTAVNSSPFMTLEQKAQAMNFTN